MRSDHDTLYAEQMDRRLARRMDRDYAAFERQMARREKARELVGQLCREGRTVFYCWPVGGRYFESTSESAVVDRLIRTGRA